MTVHQDKCALFVIRPYSAAMRSGSFRSRAEMRMHVSSEMPNAGRPITLYIFLKHRTTKATLLPTSTHRSTSLSERRKPSISETHSHY
nr:MAG TPA: hypothetical protein [Caudoviricetes sp.]